MGVRLGGRAKGTPNRVTLLKEKEVAASGLTPLGYLLSLLRDPEQPKEVRIEAARSAAPYVHPRLAQIETKAEVTVVREVSSEPLKPEEWEKAYGPTASH